EDDKARADDADQRIDEPLCDDSLHPRASCPDVVIFITLPSARIRFSARIRTSDVPETNARSCRPCERRDPYSVSWREELCLHCLFDLERRNQSQTLGLWVPAFAGTTPVVMAPLTAS